MRRGVVLCNARQIARPDGSGGVRERGVHKLCMEIKLLIANDFKNILTNK